MQSTPRTSFLALFLRDHYSKYTLDSGVRQTHLPFRQNGTVKRACTHVTHVSILTPQYNFSLICIRLNGLRFWGRYATVVYYTTQKFGIQLRPVNFWPFFSTFTKEHLRKETLKPNVFPTMSYYAFSNRWPLPSPPQESPEKKPVGFYAIASDKGAFIHLVVFRDLIYCSGLFPFRL